MPVDDILFSIRATDETETTFDGMQRNVAQVIDVFRELLGVSSQAFEGIREGARVAGEAAAEQQRAESATNQERRRDATEQRSAIAALGQERRRDASALRQVESGAAIERRREAAEQRRVREQAAKERIRDARERDRIRDRSAREERRQAAETARAQRGAAREANRTARAQQGLLRQIGSGLQFAGVFRSMTFALGSVSREYERATTRGERFNAVIPVGVGLVANLASALTRLGREGIGVVVRGSVELETSLVRLETQIGLTRSESAELGESIEDLAQLTGRNAGSLADAAFFIQSGGQRGAAANEILEASAKGAAIALGSERDIANLLTAAINAYGDESLMASRASEILLSTVREGALEANELSSSLGRVLTPASELGIELDELGAIVAFYTRTGLSATESTTALRSVLGSFIKPAEEAGNILADAGISVDDLRRSVADDGLIQTLQQLRAELGEDTSAFSKFIGRQEGIGLALALTGDRADEANDIYGRLTQQTDNLDAAFNRVSETTEFKWNQTLASLRDLGYEVGDRVLPVINEGLDVLVGLFGGGTATTELQEYVDEFGRLRSIEVPTDAYKAEREFIELLERADRAPQNLREIVELLDDYANNVDRLSEDAIRAVIDPVRELIEEPVRAFEELSKRDLALENVGLQAGEVEDQRALIAALEADYQRFFEEGFREDQLTILRAEIDLLIERLPEGRDAIRRDMIDVLEEAGVRTSDLTALLADLGVSLGDTSSESISVFRDGLRELGFNAQEVEFIVAALVRELRGWEQEAELVNLALGGMSNNVSDLDVGLGSLQRKADAFDLSKMRREVAESAATSAVLAFQLGDIAFGMAVIESAQVQISGLDTSAEARIDRITQGLLNTSDAQIQVNQAAERGSGSQNTLNEEINEAIKLLAQQQGILATTLREYNDFWTDARRASERAIEDQASALERLERDAFRSIEGLEGEQRQLRELELRQRFDALNDALEDERRQEERSNEDRIEEARDVQDRLRDIHDREGGGSGGGGSAGARIQVDVNRQSDGDEAFDFRLSARLRGLLPDDAMVLDELQGLWTSNDEQVARLSREFAEIIATFAVRSNSDAQVESNQRSFEALQGLWTSNDEQVARLSREFAEIIATFTVAGQRTVTPPSSGTILGELQSLWTSTDERVARLSREFAEIVATFAFAVEPVWSEDQINEVAEREAAAVYTLMSGVLKDEFATPVSVRGKFNLIGIDWSRKEVIAAANQEAKAVNILATTEFDKELNNTVHVSARAVVDEIVVENDQIDRDSILAARSVNDRIQLAMQRELGVRVPVGVSADGRIGELSLPSLAPGQSLLGGSRGQQGPIHVVIDNMPAEQPTVTVPAGDDSKSNYRRLEHANQRGAKDYRVSGNGR